MAAIQDLDATPPAVILPPHSSPGFFSAASTPPADAARPDRTCCCRHPEPEPASVPGDSAHYRSRIARCPRRVPGVLLAEPGDLNLARPPGPFPGLTTRGSSRSRRPARTRRSTGRRGNGTAGPRRTSSQPTARRLRPGPPPARRLPAPAVPSPDTRQRAGPPPAPGWEAAGYRNSADTRGGTDVDRGLIGCAGGTLVGLYRNAHYDPSMDPGQAERVSSQSKVRWWNRATTPS